MEFGHTQCPKCGHPVIIVVESDDSDGPYQYICTCGTAFEIKESDDVEE